ncbi:MAG TPA: DUF2339 domain-containing protein [Candidatus Acidoferrales bacterium]|nr:DUF2339 domain-containing protein [Candidatus Acidoferrales bacterium]
MIKWRHVGSHHVHGEEVFWFFLFLIVVGLILVGPILGIIAFVRVRQVERQTGARPATPQGWHRLSALEQRIQELERRLAGGAAPSPPVVVAVPSPLPTVAAAPAASPPVVAAAPAPPRAPAKPTLDWETLIAGRWLNRIGIVALFLATSFFIKLAIDNDWIGPTGQVALGLIGGTVLLVFSQWLLKRGYLYFSEGIAGLGAGVLYFSLWAGWDYYKLFPQSIAFIGMILVTAAMMGLSIGRNSQRIALLALIGGFVTPWLASTGVDAQMVLFTYLGALNAGLIGLAWTRQWRALELLAFFCTQVYFWGWYAQFYTPDRLASTSFFATMFFVLFAALPAVRAWRFPQLYAEQVVLVLINAVMYMFTLHQLLWPDRRWTLTLAVLALSAAHLLVARAVPAPSGGVPASRLLFAGLALTFVTLAIPIRLEGKWMTIAWAVEGAVLIWSGLRAAVGHLRAGGWILFGIVGIRLLAYDLHAEQVFLNERFATFAVVVACFAAALYFLRQQADALGFDERSLSALLAIAINFYSLWALSFEVWDWLRGPDWLAKGTLAPQLGLSVLWTAYAALLLVLGVKRSSPLLRWQALALFGITVAKVFLYDLDALERVYRIVSFLVLGVVLLVVSFLYQRRLAAAKAEEKS